MHLQHQLMQDNASSYAAQDTLDELAACSVYYIQWPPYSPDVNPIEAPVSPPVSTFTVFVTYR